VQAFPDDGLVEVLCAPESFEAVKSAMAAAGFTPLEAEVTMRADNDIAVTGDTALQVKKMLDMLEDLDDVQNVYSNADLGDVAYT
jgi:transcriptional/translational regulatory protein YebC/TACO1